MLVAFVPDCTFAHFLARNLSHVREGVYWCFFSASVGSLIKDADQILLDIPQSSVLCSRTCKKWISPFLLQV